MTGATYDRCYGPSSVLQFPCRPGRVFTKKMRLSLVELVHGMPGLGPIEFSMDDTGAESCQFANNIRIGWGMQDIFVADTLSGFVYSGPFPEFLDVCELIVCIGDQGFDAWVT